MFGLSAREKLKKAIITTAQTKAREHKSEITALYQMSVAKEITQEESNQRYLAILRDICDDVANTIINGISKISPKYAMTIQMNFLSPKSCGYPDIDTDEGLLGGGLYAICYNAITGKIADREDYSQLNKAYRSIMSGIIEEIQEGR